MKSKVKNIVTSVVLIFAEKPILEIKHESIFITFPCCFISVHQEYKEDWEHFELNFIFDDFIIPFLIHC